MPHWNPSPNFDAREGAAVTMLVLHYTGMRDAQAALDRLCCAEAKVSAHYVVEEDGTLHQLVQEDHRAWHAGVSCWREMQNVNAHSIGIEIVNPGHEFGYSAFPPAQMAALLELCQAILRRHPGIEARNVIGHSDVAPARKEDPGELFDWKSLAQHGVGIWPDISAAGEGSIVHSPEENDSAATAQLRHDLHLYGYDIAPNGGHDAPLSAVIRAFQRHFRPERIDGIWDGACATRLDALLRMV